MRFFPIAVLLILGFDCIKGLNLPSKNPDEGFNASLTANISGLYQAKSPCDNCVKSTAYTACHEYNHFCNEDNCGEYTDRFSAILSNFLKSVTKLIGCDDKQDGTFIIKINTSTDPAEPCENNSHDQNNIIPTIIIEASDGEESPSEGCENCYQNKKPGKNGFQRGLIGKPQKSFTLSQESSASSYAGVETQEIQPTQKGNVGVFETTQAAAATAQSSSQQNYGNTFSKFPNKYGTEQQSMSAAMAESSVAEYPTNLPINRPAVPQLGQKGGPPVLPTSYKNEQPHFIKSTDQKNNGFGEPNTFPPPNSQTQTGSYPLAKPESQSDVYLTTFLPRNADKNEFPVTQRPYINNGELNNRLSTAYPLTQVLAPPKESEIHQTTPSNPSKATRDPLLSNFSQSRDSQVHAPLPEVQRGLGKSVYEKQPQPNTVSATLQTSKAFEVSETDVRFPETSSVSSSSASVSEISQSSQVQLNRKEFADGFGPKMNDRNENGGTVHQQPTPNQDFKPSGSLLSPNSQHNPGDPLAASTIPPRPNSVEEGRPPNHGPASPNQPPPPFYPPRYPNEQFPGQWNNFNHSNPQSFRPHDHPQNYPHQYFENGRFPNYPPFNPQGPGPNFNQFPPNQFHPQYPTPHHPGQFPDPQRFNYPGQSFNHGNGHLPNERPFFPNHPPSGPGMNNNWHSHQPFPNNFHPPQPEQRHPQFPPNENHQEGKLGNGPGQNYNPFYPGNNYNGGFGNHYQSFGPEHRFYPNNPMMPPFPNPVRFDPNLFPNNSSQQVENRYQPPAPINPSRNDNQGFKKIQNQNINGFPGPLREVTDFEKSMSGFAFGERVVKYDENGIAVPPNLKEPPHGFSHSQNQNHPQMEMNNNQVPNGQLQVQGMQAQNRPKDFFSQQQPPLVSDILTEKGTTQSPDYPPHSNVNFNNFQNTGVSTTTPPRKHTEMKGKGGKTD